MALQQRFPEFHLSCVAFEEARPILRAGPPVPATFRFRGDLREVLRVIAENRNVLVDAATGAGKSTVLPLAVVKEMDCLVVQAFPFGHMAAVQHAYLTAAHPGVEIGLVSSPSQPWPKTGLVLTDAACVVAGWLQKGIVSLPECVLIHDESHESGAASAALRAFGPVADSVKSYVCMTATASPGDARKMETEGAVVDMEYFPGAFKDPWSVEESGAPWAVGSLEGNILLFEDDASRAQALVQAFNYNGVKAYRLSSGMAHRELIAIFDGVRNRRVGLCAFVADSTFRSGYTFPVSVIIDSGLVRRIVVNPEGKPVYHSRPLYEFERVQSRARGGRMKGQTTAYWRPSGELDAVMCDLGQTDSEALALICRLLGYRPPVEAAGAKMSSGQVPRDVSAALRGSTPLAALHPNALCELSEIVKQGPSQDPGEVLMEEESRTVVADRAPTASTEGFSDCMDFLATLVMRTKCESTIDFGTYHMVEGVVTTDVECGMLPDGASSVRRILARSKSGVTHMDWSPYVRSVAVNALLSDHNAALMELRALTGAISVLRSEVNRNGAHAAGAWAKSSMERLGLLTSEVSACLKCVEILAEDFCSVKSVGLPYGEDENAWSGALVQSYLKFSRAVDTTEVERKRLRERSHMEIQDCDTERLPAGSRRKRRSSGVDSWSPTLLQWFSGYTPPRSGKPVRTVKWTTNTDKPDSSHGRSRGHVSRGSTSSDETVYDLALDHRRVVKPVPGVADPKVNHIPFPKSYPVR